MLSVTTAALTTDLTILETVKTELQITDTSEDDYLTRQIAVASAAICTYLSVVMADDGTVTLGRETLVQTFTPSSYNGFLVMARRPIVSVTSVEEDGSAIDASEYSFDFGRIKRLGSSSWTNVEYAVEYTAGWLLPGDSGRNLPVEIEDAAIALIKANRFSRSRDPLLKSENILEGLYGYSLFDPRDGSAGLPPEVSSKIDRFRNVFV